MPHLLIFTPTTPGGLRFATLQSVVSQRFTGEIRWEIGRCNPYLGRDMRNVLAQYSYARDMALRGPYDALVTVEQDMILPDHALATLWEDGAAVVYGTYMLRHGMPVINALKYEGERNLGMSLSLFSGALPQAFKLGRVEVSGVGFGCTLIRRQVLEAIPFRQDSSGNAPDMPFALDCVRTGIEQIARLDVPCGHMHEETILEISNKGGTTVKVKCIQSVNILVEGASVQLAEGDEIALSLSQAQELTSLGYLAPAPETAAIPAKKAAK